MKITFLIRSLDYGGAERQMVELAKGLNRRGHEVEIMVFYGGFALERDLIESGLEVYSLNKATRWDIAAFLMKLFRTMRKSNPEILHSYLGTANTLAVLLKPFLPNTRIVWGVRASNMNLEEYDWVSRWSYKIESWLAPFAHLIICNSQAGRNHAAAKGFPQNKMIVIPNGIDTARFKPDLMARVQGRENWEVGAQDILIGLVARLDPIKGHTTFLRAAAKYAQDRSDVRFVCVGDGPKNYFQKLQQLSESLGLRERIIWAGSQNDMPIVYNALDIMTLSSYGESFSNAIGEAMACGIPCIVTNVGDLAQIVGETGGIVPPYDEDALVAAWRSVEGQARQQLGHLARARICEHFSCESLVEKTESALFDEVSVRHLT